MDLNMEMNADITKTDISCGTFAALELSRKCRVFLIAFIEEVLGLEKHVMLDELHCTVICTSTPIDDTDTAFGGNVAWPIIAIPEKYSVFTMRDGIPCLVLVLSCDAACDLHEAMKAIGGSESTFAYCPHVTLSYELHEFISESPTAFELHINSLPLPPFSLEFEALTVRPSLPGLQPKNKIHVNCLDS